MAPKTLQLERDGPWLRVWFNRPESRNALSQHMADDIMDTLDSAEANAAIRGLVFRGRGGIFCAGGDLKSFRSGAEGGDATRATVLANSKAGGRLLHRLNEFPKPVVMLVEGAALAGGLGLACVGDVVIATADARFALTETTLGLIPAQIAPFVVARVGLSRARQLMLTAARFDGRAAADMGLVHAVAKDADELEHMAHAVLKDMARCAPNANAVTKKLLFQCGKLSADEMTDYAAEAFTDALLGPEGREGVAAFAEKRKPSWAVTKDDE